MVFSGGLAVSNGEGVAGAGRTRALETRNWVRTYVLNDFLISHAAQWPSNCVAQQLRVFHGFFRLARSLSRPVHTAVCRSVANLSLHVGRAMP